MSDRAIICIQLPKDRRVYGRLSIYTASKGAKLSLHYSGVCLGKSDNLAAAKALNPLRNPVKKYGDTPTGIYVARSKSAWKPADKQDERSYGPYIVNLDPIQKADELPEGDLKAYLEAASVSQIFDLASSQAAAAERNGRDGILIHGGEGGVGGILRPTHGCVRVDNATAAKVNEGIPAGGCICIVSEDYLAVNQWADRCKAMVL